MGTPKVTGQTDATEQVKPQKQTRAEKKAAKAEKAEKKGVTPDSSEARAAAERLEEITRPTNAGALGVTGTDDNDNVALTPVSPHQITTPTGTVCRGVVVPINSDERVLEALKEKGYVDYPLPRRLEQNIKGQKYVFYTLIEDTHIISEARGEYGIWSHRSVE